MGRRRDQSLAFRDVHRQENVHESLRKEEMILPPTPRRSKPRLVRRLIATLPWLAWAAVVDASSAETRLQGWGNVGLTVVGSMSDLSEIDAGAFNTLAVKQDGTVVAWGRNDVGQCVVPSTLTDVVEASAGYYHSVALKSDGTVVCWGSDGYGQSSVPVGLSGVVQVQAGDFHTVALK